MFGVCAIAHHHPVAYNPHDWPAPLSVDYARQCLERELSRWRCDRGYTDNLIAAAAAVSGHCEGRLPEGTHNCSCGQRFEEIDLCAGAAAQVRHLAAKGCLELERRGMLVSDGAPVAQALFLADFPGSFDDLAGTVAAILA